MAFVLCETLGFISSTDKRFVVFSKKKVSPNEEARPGKVFSMKENGEEKILKILLAG
jgi:hypothetical protein